MTSHSHDATPTSAMPPNGKLLNEHVSDVMQYFFNALEGEEPENVYQLVIEEVEKPLLVATLDFTNGNQSRAASILGLNRTTLRKKLRAHDLL